VNIVGSVQSLLKVYEGKSMFFGDVVEKNGKTVRENNMAQTHNFPIGSLVEIKDTQERLYVKKHTRDCDGTPLYSLSVYKDIDEVQNRWDRVIMYSAEGLILIRTGAAK
jgi:hypothetical protein